MLTPLLVYVFRFLSAGQNRLQTINYELGNVYKPAELSLIALNNSSDALISTYLLCQLLNIS